MDGALLIKYCKNIEKQNVTIYHKVCKCFPVSSNYLWEELYHNYFPQNSLFP